MEVGSRFLPSSFSVSELFLFATLNAYYTGFFIDSALYRDQRSEVDNVTNMLVFSPWAFANFLALFNLPLACLEDRYVFRFTNGFKAFITTSFSVYMVYWFLAPDNDMATLTAFAKHVIVEQLPLFFFMLVVLLMGMLLIGEFRTTTANFKVRKMFHLLAFILFTPGIMMAKFERPLLLVFALNCVTVALVILELVRYSGLVLSPEQSSWFKQFCEGRERLQNTTIFTHIYLLMGCGFPL